MLQQPRARVGPDAVDARAARAARLRARRRRRARRARRPELQRARGRGDVRLGAGVLRGEPV